MLCRVVQERACQWRRRMARRARETSSSASTSSSPSTSTGTSVSRSRNYWRTKSCRTSQTLYHPTVHCMFYIHSYIHRHPSLFHRSEDKLKQTQFFFPLIKNVIIHCLVGWLCSMYILFRLFYVQKNSHCKI